VEISRRLGYGSDVRLALVVVVCCAISGVAAAQRPSPEYTRALQGGIDALRLGKHDVAKQQLDLARNLDLKAAEPHRWLAALAHARLRFDECIEAARKALRLEPTGREVADTRKLHEDCRSKAGRPAFAGELGEQAAISVSSNPPGAAVRIRGLAVGGTPIAPRTIAPGQVVVDIVKSGFLPGRADVDVLPGIVTDVSVDLVAGVETAPNVEPSFGTLLVPLAPRREVLIDGRLVKTERTQLSPGIHIVEVREPDRDPWRRRVAITVDREQQLAPELVDSRPRESKRRIGKIALGAGTALAVLGVGAFYISRNAAEDARDILRIEIERPIGDTTPPLRTRADFEAARDKANRWATLSNVSWAAGFAAAGAGFYLLYRNRDRDGDAPDFAIAPVRGGAIAGASLVW
jgi:hypothetical protein